MVRKVANNNSVTVSFGAAFAHLRALIKSLGFMRALVESARIVIRLSSQENTEIRFRRAREVSPIVPGAPLGWMSGLTTLLKQSRESLDQTALEYRIRQLVHRQVHMRNIPEHASVSIVIPAFENGAQVFSCVESILSWPSGTNVRILVGDDSLANDLTCLGSVIGVTVVKQPINLGFLHNVNSLVKLVDTEYVLILNQDTLLLPGAIDDLRKHLASEPSVGVIAPMILDRNLSVLELGGLLDTNGNARLRCRGLDFSDWNRLYSTDVQYVSGCAMMLRTDVWKKLGGFDPVFAPGYYEDVDLCLRVRRLGLRVRSVSSSFVVHLEGSSHGVVAEDKSSIKSAQITNRDVLVAKWGLDSLAEQAVSHSTKRPVIALFDRLPDPARDGGSSDARNFVGHLVTLGHSVSVVSLVEETALSTHELRRIGVECVKNIRVALDQVQMKRPIVLSFGLSAGQYLRGNLPKSADITWVHIATDVVTRRLESALANIDTSSQIDAISTKWHVSLPSDPRLLWEIERDVIQMADRVLYVSREDKNFVEERIFNKNGTLFQILKGDPVSATEPVTSAPIVSMVGYWRHHPNREALKHMMTSIWPLVKQLLPDARLLLWGSHADTEVLSYSKVNLDVHNRGWFRDWSQVAAATRVIASPVHEGAGMKNHVVSAILAGRPVIGTRLSFDGLPQSPAKDEYTAASPEKFARLLVDALTSDDQWRAIVAAQQALLGDFQGADQERERLRLILAELP